MKSKGTQQHHAAEFLSVYYILLKMQACMKRETNPLSRLRFKQVQEATNGLVLPMIATVCTFLGLPD